MGLFYEEELVKIYNGDAEAEMSKMDDGSVDLVVTSPPYNLKNSSGWGLKGNFHKSNNWHKAHADGGLHHGYEDHDDNMPHEEYVEWQRACLTEMMRLLSPRGAIFYNHKWRVQRGLIQNREDIVSGFPVRQILIWQRSGGMNFNKGYFLPTYEVIYVICNKDFKLNPKANALGDVWRINQTKNIPHPAPMPYELADRIVKSSPALKVLDPFAGSGTTLLAARDEGIKSVGIEINKKYCDVAVERLGENAIQ